jgi:6-phosphofructokinase 2
MPEPIVTICLNPAIDKCAAVTHVTPEHKLRCTNPHFDAGGGGLNVARVVHRLGGTVTAVYPAGGLTGEMLIELMHEDGVPHVPIRVVGLTRENLHIDETSTGQQYRFNMPGVELTEAEWNSCFDAALSLDPRPEWVIFSGSLAPGVPPTCLADLAKRCKAEGMRLVADTSGDALREAVRAGVSILKPNQKELGELVGRELEGDGEIFSAARAILDTGGSDLILVSMAAAGLLVVSHDEVYRVAAPPVKPVSRVGAGDSSLAALVLKLAQGRPLKEAARYAVAAGTAAVLGHGTDLCKVEDVDRLMASMLP